MVQLGLFKDFSGLDATRSKGDESSERGNDALGADVGELSSGVVSDVGRDCQTEESFLGLGSSRGGGAICFREMAAVQGTREFRWWPLVNAKPRRIQTPENELVEPELTAKPGFVIDL